MDRSIEPFEFTEQEIKEHEEFSKKVAEYTIEAVRRQMESGSFD